MSVLLLCIPHAGAGSGVFRAWQALGVPGVQVHPVSLPGRDYRLDEQPFTEAMPCVEAIEEEVSPLLADERPTVLFGHCLGALLAFELAARLQSRRGALRLIASGCPGPWNQREEKIGGIADDDEFLDSVSRVAGYRDPSMQDPELRELVLPALRADVLMQESYRPSVSGPLTLPVIAVRGSRDEILSQPDAASWQHATSGEFELRELPGGHLYYLEQGRALLEMAASLAVRSASAGQPAAGGTAFPGATGPAARDELAQQLAELWRRLLSVEKVGVRDDFFQLGGNSNSAILMIAQAKQRGIAITLRDLFRLRTAEAIADYCVRSEAP